MTMLGRGKRQARTQAKKAEKARKRAEEAARKAKEAEAEAETLRREAEKAEAANHPPKTTRPKPNRNTPTARQDEDSADNAPTPGTATKPSKTPSKSKTPPNDAPESTSTTPKTRSRSGARSDEESESAEDAAPSESVVDGRAAGIGVHSTTEAEPDLDEEFARTGAETGSDEEFEATDEADGDDEPALTGKAAEADGTRTKVRPKPRRGSDDELDEVTESVETEAEPDDELDVDDLQDEDEDEEEDGPTARSQPRRRRLGIRFGTRSYALIVVNLVLIGLLGWLVVAVHGLKEEQKAVQQVTFAAKQAAEDLSSYDYRTIDADLKRATDHTTGNFRNQFTQMTSQVKPSATELQAVVEGTAVRTSVESVDGGKAIALVYLNQQTVKAANQQRTPSQYTLRLVMTKVGDRWLVSQLQML